MFPSGWGLPAGTAKQQKPVSQRGGFNMAAGIQARLSGTGASRDAFATTAVSNSIPPALLATQL